MAIIPQPTSGERYLESLCGAFYDNARRSPDDEAIIFQEMVLTNNDLVLLIDEAILHLQRMGVQQRDRVVYLGWNHPSFMVALLALAKMGAVFVALNPRSTAAEAAYIIDDCGASAVISEESFAETLASVSALSGGWSSQTVESVIHFADLPKLRLSQQTPGISTCPSGNTNAQDTAVMLYTSGTTGRPKGVMITHGNVWATTLCMQIVLKLSTHSTLLLMAPMFHIGALANALAAVAAGGRAVILTNFDPDDVFDAIERWGVTNTFGVPTMLQTLQAHSRFHEISLSNLTVTVAGSPVPVTLLEVWINRGVRILQGYGMTEGPGSMLDADKALDKIGSAGLPLPLTDIQIRDIETGLPISESDWSGEIWMKGPAIAKGYWNLALDTQQAFDDGWLATGDIGRWDADGYLYIVDRMKDMIISGGVNVYPAEVEQVLLQYEGIHSAAVIGLPDSKWGEKVSAIVVPAEGDQFSVESLLAFCKQRLSGYKCPKEVFIRESLPLGPSGKVLKKDLRELYTPVKDD